LWRTVGDKPGAAGREGTANLIPVNGLVERFNGRVQREVLGITIYSHRDLETLLKGFNQAYTRGRQRVLKGASPEQVVQRRLAAEPKLANRRYKPPDLDALPPALQVVAHAKEVSHQTTSPFRL
jgi:hypothetical protein